MGGSRGYPHTPLTELLFPSKGGKRITWIRRSFHTALRRTGIEDLHFHDLRHTFASQWMMNGGDTYVLKEILGHKSLAMTQRYSHLSPAYKQAMVQRMERIWSSKPVQVVGTGAETDSQPKGQSQGKAA